MLNQASSPEGYGTINPFVGLGIIEIVIILILIIIIALLINTIFLKIALRIVDSKHTDFGEVFVTALICAILNLIPCIGCILSWFVINARHDTGLVMAIVVWLLAILIGLIITIFIVIALVGLLGITLAVI
ncbi:MAG: hypothetical protein ACTSR8_03175 [Promethearchaeota archaeon]